MKQEGFLGLFLAHRRFHPIRQIICGAKFSRGQRSKDNVDLGKAKRKASV